MSSMFMHVVTCVRISLLLKAEEYSIAFIYRILLICSPISGHKVRLDLLAIVKDAAQNMGVRRLGGLVF